MTKTTVPTAPATFHVEQTPGVLSSPESDARVIAQQLLGLRIGESATINGVTITRADDRWYIRTASRDGFTYSAAAAAICALGWAQIPRGWESV